jgi:hypothetical protein
VAKKQQAISVVTNQDPNQCCAGDGCRPRTGVPGILTDKRASLQAEYKTLKGNYPEADTQYRQLFKVLCDTCCGRGEARMDGNSQRCGINHKQLLQGALRKDIV